MKIATNYNQLVQSAWLVAKENRHVQNAIRFYGMNQVEKAFINCCLAYLPTKPVHCISIFDTSCLAGAVILLYGEKSIREKHLVAQPLSLN